MDASRADDSFAQSDTIAPEATTALDAVHADGQVAPPDRVPFMATAVDDGRAADRTPPEFGEGDVLFHVTNETGVDVFVNDDRPLALAQREYVDIYHPCGSDCPVCACKECPITPPRYRRIANRHTWVYGWGRRMFVEQGCRRACPCVREVDASPGVYSVTLQGKGGSNPPRTGKGSLFDPRPEERYVDCEATGTFVLKPGAHVDLKLTCQR